MDDDERLLIPRLVRQITLRAHLLGGVKTRALSLCR